MRTEEVFMKMFLSVLPILESKKSKLTGQDYRILFSLCKNSNWGGEVFKKQAVLAKSLDMAETQITSSIKKLANLKIILKKKDENFGLYYEFNPDFFQKGNPKENKNVVVRKRKVESSKIVPLKKVK